MDGTSNTLADNALTTSDLFKNKKCVVFWVPAPFTGTCTQAHVPSFTKLVPDFHNKGVDSIICCSVADPYAMYNWAQRMGVYADSGVTFLSDWDGAFAREHDMLGADGNCGLGIRSKRISMVVEDGVVSAINVVEDAEKDGEVCLGQC